MASGQSYVLAVDFKWSKFHALITEFDTANPEPKPLYDVSYGMLAPHLKIKSIQEDRQIGTGTVHTISISPDYSLHGSKGTIQAKSRLRTIYTHMSHTFSDTDKPAKMTWSSQSGFTTWDFICCDENQIPVAKFSANVWALKKMAKIEVSGPKAFDTAALDEIVTVGMTLYFCMCIRINNPLNLVGSAFMRTGKEAQIEAPRPQRIQGNVVD
ncbi:hypothetical protein N7490_007891 [Penicillium lividum]|nr:hypothetical protein N7490_007891 [Penicillium lividum]